MLLCGSVLCEAAFFEFSCLLVTLNGMVEYSLENDSVIVLRSINIFRAS